MPYEITTQPDLRGVTARAYGAGDRDEGLRMIAEAFERVRETSARTLIVDVLELEFVPSSADASVFSGQLAIAGRAGVRVAVIAPPGAPFGVARMVAFLAEISGSSVTVCGTREEALEWARCLSGAVSRGRE